MKPFWKKLLKTVGIVCGVIVGVLALALAVASIAEYRPKETETLELVGKRSRSVMSLRWFPGTSATADSRRPRTSSWTAARAYARRTRTV